MQDTNLSSILDIVRACEAVYLSTFGLDIYPDGRYITNAINRETVDMTLYFLTGAHTPKFAQLKENPHCCLYYFNPENRHAVRLYGTMEFVTDRATRLSFWNDDFLVYGYGGPDDDTFVLMRFVPKSYKFYVGPEMKTGTF